MLIELGDQGQVCAVRTVGDYLEAGGDMSQSPKTSEAGLLEPARRNFHSLAEAMRLMKRRIVRQIKARANRRTRRLEIKLG